jgi:hypothetical protein
MAHVQRITPVMPPRANCILGLAAVRETAADMLYKSGKMRVKTNNTSSIEPFVCETCGLFMGKCAKTR